MTQPEDNSVIANDEPLLNIPVEPPPPVFVYPPIAGFWRRFFAWLLDSLLLAILGQLIGWPFSGFWFQVGPYGRIVGLVVMLLYFGLLNSRVGNGQTFGKRLLKIAVRGSDNKPIGIGVHYSEP